MHKKLEAELISIAHQILQMKDKDDVVKLKNKAKDVYEKLSVLAFVDNYFLTTPNASENKDDLIDLLQKAKAITAKKVVEETKKEEIIAPKVEKTIVEKQVEERIIEEKVEEPIVEKKVEVKKEDPKVLIELEKQTQKILQSEANEIVTKITEQEATYLKSEVQEIIVPNKKSLANNEEFKDSIPADVAANLFEKATNLKNQSEAKKTNVAVKIEEKKALPKQETKTSLNDRLLSQKIQVGLNDRIAFVKHLFNFSQEDFNRVLSQLNTFETEKESKEFINNQVKPDYNWSGKEEYEERLITLIERKFM